MFRLVAVLASLAFVQPAAADCALSGLRPKVVTRPNAAIHADGGIVVMAESHHQGKLEKGEAAIQKSWRFKGRTDEPAFVSLAPGLAMIKLPKDANGRATDAELFDDKTSLIVVKVAASNPSEIKEPPKVQSIVQQERVSRRISSRVTVNFAALPPGVIAVVLAEPNGKARSYGLVKDLAPGAGKGTAIPVDAYAHHECQVLPNGTVPSKAGDLVVVRFVDEHGRLSQPSKPIKIVKSTGP